LFGGRTTTETSLVPHPSGGIQSTETYSPEVQKTLNQIDELLPAQQTQQALTGDVPKDISDTAITPPVVNKVAPKLMTPDGQMAVQDTLDQAQATKPALDNTISI